jgi:hypothetical protein
VTVSQLTKFCLSESYVTTDGQSASLSWNKAPIWGSRPDFYCCQTVPGLLVWAALSDDRPGLSFTIASGPRQRSHSRIRVPCDSRSYFTVSDSSLPFSSPPTTRRATVEVFDAASTRDSNETLDLSCLQHLGTECIRSTSPNDSSIVASRNYRTDRVENISPQSLHCCVLRICCLTTGVFEEPFPSNDCLCWLHSSCLEQIYHNTIILRENERGDKAENRKRRDWCKTRLNITAAY